MGLFHLRTDFFQFKDSKRIYTQRIIDKKLQKVGVLFQSLNCYRLLGITALMLDSNHDNNRRLCKRYGIATINARLRKRGTFQWCSRKVTSCNVVNIGKGGFRFSTAISFHTKDPLDIELLVDGETVKIKGFICYKNKTHDQYTYGVKFDDIYVSLVRTVKSGNIPILIEY